MGEWEPCSSSFAPFSATRTSRMKRKTRSVINAEEIENFRNTCYRASTDPLHRLPSEVTLHVLSFNKLSEIRYLSQASKDHREFIVINGLLQYGLISRCSYNYYQGLSWEGRSHPLIVDLYWTRRYSCCREEEGRLSK